ncbi:MAG: nucleotidyltransferase family protein [Alphaproteobacteria bacterium]|nr:nucleotidyltransferase family protein [Alphaproteobacteria bacterium]
MITPSSHMNRIGAVVLAAGLSSRMGANKLLLPFRGKPLIRLAVEAAAASRATTVVVVTGNNAEKVKAAVSDLLVKFVENKDYTKGLSGSLKCGLRTLPSTCEGVAILLGDMPLVTSGLLDRMIAVFDPGQGCAIVVPVRHGRRGNPVLWARQFFPEMLALEGDAGAKGLMSVHHGQVYELEAGDDGPLFDVDTPENLAAYNKP